MIDNRTIGTLLKALPAKLTKSGDNEEWGIATVDVIDREGDIIRSDGVSLELHSDSSPLKIIGAAHKANNVLPDGSYPIMGIAKGFERIDHDIKGKTYPALAFKYEYDRDGEALTPYAAKMKSLFKTGKLDSFSVGVDPIEVKELKGGRFDVRKCRLFEISACLVPTNPYTRILKALRSELGDDFDAMQVIEERLIQMQQASDERLATFIASLTKAFQTRFDDFESAAAARAVKPAPSPATDSVEQPDVHSIVKSLEALTAKV
jgi:hypothetical protein